MSSRYTVRPYSAADAARLAVMWNESDDQWPGTWTNGVPMTADRVRQWLEAEMPLQGLVVEDTQDGAIVAFGSMFEELGEESTAYVALLNVHPKHQKRSLCRRMLTNMIDWSVENNYRRMTLGTWSANLKSVPLYKKTGFNWVPNTEVFMENYIPTVRLTDLGRLFFAKHDWYTTFNRELKQIEDDVRHPATGEMKVFIYRWEADSEMIEAVIDRQAQAPTGWETKAFAAYASVTESEPAQGIAYPVRWQIQNKQDQAMAVSLRATGDSGVEIDQEIKLTLSPGEVRQIEGEVRCRVDAPRMTEDRKKKPAPAVRTRLDLAGEMIDLRTGLRYHAALEFSLEPEVPSMLPGQTKEVCLQIRSRLPQPAQGTLQITATAGLEVEAETLAFQIEANGYTGLPLTLRAGGTSTLLAVQASFTTEQGQTVTMEPEKLPILIMPLGSVAAQLTEDKIYIENDIFQLQFKAFGGGGSLYDKTLDRRVLRGFSEELGKPFYPHVLNDTTYQLALEQGQGWVKAILSAPHRRYPGVTLTREVLVTSSPLITLTYRVQNTGTQSHKFQLEHGSNFNNVHRGHYTFARQDDAKTGFPVVTIRASALATGDFPEEAEKLAEQWMACTRQGIVNGLIWPENLVRNEFDWSWLSLRWPELSLEPDQNLDLGTLYFYSGPGDWQLIRSLWQRLTNQAEDDEEVHEQAWQPLRYGWQTEPLVTLNKNFEATFQATNAREKALSGQVQLNPPQDWSLDQTLLNLTGLDKDHPLTQAITLTTADETIEAQRGYFALDTDLFHERQPFTLIRLGDDTKNIDVSEGQGQQDDVLWTLDNGHQRWVLAPEFHGGLIAWHEADSEVNHLYTKYPDPSMISWINSWYGGIRPYIFPLHEEGGWPGKLQEEKFTVTMIDAADTANLAGFGNLPWQGLRARPTLTKKGFEGIRLEIDYLTLPGSNVLKVVFRMWNDTSVYREVDGGLMAYFQVDGTHTNGVLYSPDQQRKRTSHMDDTGDYPWAAVVNPETNRAIISVTGTRPYRIHFQDLGVDGGYITHARSYKIKPQASKELVTYFALAESLAEAKLYAKLGV